MRIEKKAAIISTTTAGILILFKLTIALISGSIAVLASAIDSLLDFAVSLFNFFTLSHSDKEADEKFNFGRSKLEPLASVIEGTIISISALFILYSATDKIIHPLPVSYMQEAIFVMLFSIIVTFALVMYLNYIARKNNNMVIKADALHYKTDLFSNGAILVALVAMHFTNMSIIDPILGIFIAIYMIYSAYPLIKEGILMLLDAALEGEELQAVQDILDNSERISSYHDLKTRRSANDIFISVHLVFEHDISLLNAHNEGDKIELALQQLFLNENVHTIVHLDPYDDSHKN